MKKAVSIFLFFLIHFSLKSQSPCYPASNGEPAGEYPPGCLMCGNMYVSSNVGYDSTAVSDIDYPCGKVQNNLFVSVIADSTRDLSFSIYPGNCTNMGGLELVLYDQMMNPISDCHPTDRGFANLNSDVVIPGEIYHLMIDGFAGATCDFILRLNRGAILSTPDTTNIGNIPPEIISSRSTECTDTEICFSTTYGPGMTGFFWDKPSYLEVTKGGGLRDTFMCVKFKLANTGFARYRAVYGCYLGERRETFVEIGEIRDSLNPSICPGELLTIGGKNFSSEGIFEVVLPNAAAGGCDSIILLNLTIVDTSSFEVFCLLDTFLNALSFGWDNKPLADAYQVFINDSLVSTQTFSGYIYGAGTPGEEIEVRIQPISSFSCSYPSSSITCKIEGSSSVENTLSADEIQVFPNPSKGKFEIYSNEEVRKIEVFDYAGNLLIEKISDEKIDLTALDSGVYFLKIYFAQKTTTKRVIKI